MMSTVDQLLTLADLFCGVAGRSDSTLSKRVFGDGTKIGKLRVGAGITTNRAERAILWFSANWPEAAAWPAAVPRPSPSSDAARDAAPADATDTTDTGADNAD